jgi:murein DD-endopeptidase MepM/ murein hydrolase activator NlpD
MKRFIILCLMAFSLQACAVAEMYTRGRPEKVPDNLVASGSATVEKGDTAYRFANRHKVSMQDLIALNRLRAPYSLTPGQTLKLPANRDGSTGAPAYLEAAPVAGGSLSGTGSLNGGGRTGPANGSGVTSEELPPLTAQSTGAQSTAGQSPPQKNEDDRQQAAILTAPALSIPAATAEPESLAPVPEAAPAALPVSVAAPSAEDVNGPMTAGRFTWPVEGPVLSSYGAKVDGLQNDGINIAAPKGTPVVSADAGTVVYAGNEMKGFGNLVLVRHQGNWITAYAHLDRMFVQKDAILAKGDMVGTVGSSGGVSKPQLHFETRQGTKAFDPMKQLAPL